MQCLISFFVFLFFVTVRGRQKLYIITREGPYTLNTQNRSTLAKEHCKNMREGNYMTGYVQRYKKGALARNSFPTKYLLFFQPVLKPCKARLKTNQTCCLARKHKAQLGHIIVYKAAWLVHFCQQLHFLESRNIQDQFQTQISG